MCVNEGAKLVKSRAASYVAEPAEVVSIYTFQLFIGGLMLLSCVKYPFVVT